MFESLRSRLAFEAIRKWVSSHARTRKTYTLHTATSIGVLFDASAEKVKIETLAWIKILEKSGKKVQVLGFLNDKKTPVPAPDFDFFTAKDISWTYAPQGEKPVNFANAAHHVLICINPAEIPAISWVAARSKAAMKIGMATAHTNDYDLQIDTPIEKGVQFFAEQLNFYLEKIKTA